MAVLLLSAAVHADLQLFDDFNGKTAVDNTACTGVLGGWVDTDSDGSGNITLTTGDGTLNLTTFINLESNSGGDERGVAVFGVSDPIDDGEQGVVFFRFRLLSAGRTCYHWFGVHPHNFTTAAGDAIGTGNENDVLNVMSAGFLCYRATTSGPISIRTVVAGDNNHGGTEVTTIEAGLWYDCWFDVDNGADTFDLYIQPSPAGTAGGLPPDGPTTDPLLDDAPFHSTPPNGGLYGIICHQPDDDGSDPRPWADRSLRCYLDDIYWDGSQGMVSLGASKPDPANGADHVAIAADLSWQAPTSPDVFELLGYTVYMDPNVVMVTSRHPDALKSADQIGTTYTPASSLEFVKTYYWAVDTTITLNSDPNDPKIPVEVPGKVWSFTTTDPGPQITSDPADALVDAGQTASFTAGVSSPYYAASYKWFKTPDRVNNTPLDDDEIAGATALTLDIVTAAVADEGYYYCQASNVFPGNGQTYIAKTAPAALAIKRKVAHWTLDTADYVGGQYLDSSGEGHHADPNAPVEPVAGQNPDGAINPEGISYQGMTINPDGGWAKAGTWDPSQYSNQVTVSLWVMWNGQPVAPRYQGLMGKRSVFATDMRWQLEIGNNAASLLTFKSNQGAGASSPILPVGEWEQVVCTCDGTTGRVYRNGTFAASAPVTLTAGPTANLVIGACGLDPATPNAPTSILDGVLDDIQVYNYPLDALTIASVFAHTDGLGRKACLDPQDPILVAYDVDDDCEVGLGDLIDVAVNWLGGQLVPDVVEERDM